MRSDASALRQRWKQVWTSPWLIIGVALLMRLSFTAAWAPWQDDLNRLVLNAPNADSGSYHTAALVLMRYWNRPGVVLEEQPEAVHAILNRPPGYPLLMASVYSLFGMRPVWIVWLQVLLDVAACWLAIRALTLIRDARAGALGGWLYALNPLLINATGHVLSESVFVFLLTLSLLWFACLRIRPSWWSALALGLTIGVGATVRASLLYFAPVLIVMFLTQPLAWRQRLGLSGWYVTGIAALLTPWVAYNWVHYGSTKLTLAGEYHLLHMAAYLKGGERVAPSAMRGELIEAALARMRHEGLDPNRQIFERGRYYRAVALEFMRQNPRTALSLWIRGMAGFWRSAGGVDAPSESLREARSLKLYFQLYHGLYIVLLAAGLWRVWG
ncbi:MAG: glycosyltransferase family 39 protein, partial [Fimbriimonadales bacterium]|nr:glycosyltransferase family 39 protein [Fimbriimonadales bacterium]